MEDANKKEIKLEDYEAKKVTGVQIGQSGHKLWICIDGIAVLRVKSPLIILEDAREGELKQQTIDTLEWMITDMKWRSNQTKGNLEEGSQGGYSPELTRAIELLKRWKELKNDGTLQKIPPSET